MKVYRKTHINHITRLLSAFLLLFPLGAFRILAHTPTDTIREQIVDRIENIMERHYYTNADSALMLLTLQGDVARRHHLTDLYLTVLLNKAWVAEHHRKIDSLYRYIILGDDIQRRNSAELEQLDSARSLRSEFVYMKGMYNYIMGDLPVAIENFKEAIYYDGTLIVTDSLYTFDALCNIGQLYTLIPDFVQAIYYYNVARDLLPRKSSSYDAVRDYQYQLAFLEVSMASVEFHKNKSNKKRLSVRKYQQVLGRLRGKESEPGARNLLLTIYNRMSDIYVHNAQYDSAVYWSNRSLFVMNGGDSQLQIKTLLAAGSVNREALKFRDADRYISKAIDIASSSYPGRHRFMAMALYEKGLVESSQKKWTSALNVFQQALLQLTDHFTDTQFDKLPSVLTTTDENTLIKIIIEKANTFYAWHKTLPGDHEKLQNAIAHYEYAVNRMDHIKLLLQHEQSEQMFSSTFQSLFERSIAACYDAFYSGMGEAYLSKVFYFMEKNKASILLRATRKLTAQQFTSIPASITSRESLLKGKLYYLQHKLLSLKSTLEVNATQVELLNVREAYHAMVDSLEKLYPAYYKLKYDTHIETLEKIKHKLIGNDNAIVEFFYGEHDLYILLISSVGTQLKRVALTEDFRSALIGLLANIKRNPATIGNDFQGILSSASILYQHLVEPINNQLPSYIKKLMIIPDGLLGYLPFEVLVASPGYDGVITELHHPDYLLKRFTIRYAPSANMAMVKNISDNKTASYTYLGFAPSYERNIAGVDPHLRQSNDDYFRQVDLLNFNDVEVKRASTCFSKSKNFYGGEASERSFKTYGSKGRIVHLATHAVVNDENSLYSALLFSKIKYDADPKHHSDEDGFLYLYELYNMKLQAELVVLSACETGVGEYYTGEGVMSIGRGFQYAGCPSVATSLWQVNDKSTSLIMGLFFDNIRKGLPKDEALQHAKISFLQDPENRIFSHPYFWSAVILVGDESPIVIEQSNTVVATFTVLIMSIIGIWVFKIYFRKRYT